MTPARLESAQDLRKIQSAGKHLLAVINDVLDLSKIEAGKMGMHLENFEICPVIQELVTTIKPAVEKNSNLLTVHMAQNLGSMRAEPPRSGKFCLTC
jgi:signal transduction histidine kinase